MTTHAGRLPLGSACTTKAIFDPPPLRLRLRRDVVPARQHRAPDVPLRHRNLLVLRVLLHALPRDQHAPGRQAKRDLVPDEVAVGGTTGGLNVPCSSAWPGRSRSDRGRGGGGSSGRKASADSEASGSAPIVDARVSALVSAPRLPSRLGADEALELGPAGRRLALANKPATPSTPSPGPAAVLSSDAQRGEVPDAVVPTRRAPARRVGLRAVRRAADLDDGAALEHVVQDLEVRVEIFRVAEKMQHLLGEASDRVTPRSCGCAPRGA